MVKFKKIVRGSSDPVTEDRVYWGLAAEGEKAPEAMFSERKHAEALFALLPAPQREKMRIVRMYVTVWVIGDKGRIPKKSPRGKVS
jgi:hypothetical protein